jgi:UPF0176 protein
MTPIIVVAFYKFATLPDYAAFQAPLLDLGQRYGLRGSILLASEGINSTVAGSREGIDQLLAYLQADPRLSDLDYKESSSENLPFKRFKVRLKQEIVTMGLPEVDPQQGVGTYIEPQDWNDFITQEDVLLIDARNDFEVQLGTFQRAVNPQTHSFGQLPAFLDQTMQTQQPKKVAMFCTGGIRCEKATAYLQQQGIEEVYHLKGGILRYLAEINPEDSLWQGECFVFDERVSLGHGLEQGQARFCPNCKTLLKENVPCGCGS